MRRAAAFAAAIAIVAACGRPHPAIEAVMKQDLAEMRKAIHDFRVDKKRPPVSLKGLVEAHYLRVIPNDPVTRAPDWRVVTEAPVRLDEFRKALPLVQSGIVDIRSSAPGTDSNGKPWSEY
ncbi:MAG: hypothetical protein DMF59_02600 [Acidobacteria bacterium]|nr:MAG: hypothetical protein DMF59_02600 [Acidobacteriota bacterium]